MSNHAQQCAVVNFYYYIINPKYHFSKMSALNLLTFEVSDQILNHSIRNLCSLYIWKSTTL